MSNLSFSVIGFLFFMALSATCSALPLTARPQTLSNEQQAAHGDSETGEMKSGRAIPWQEKAVD